MLQPGGNTSITNNTVFQRCKAWSTGGALATEMGNDTTTYDLSTTLNVSGTFEGNIGSGKDLWVGPGFYLHITDSNINMTSRRVVWHKRKCGKGEYIVATTGFCELCPPFTYSLLPFPHEERVCSSAPVHAYAPGGAVLVPMTSHWHGSAETMPALHCEGCNLGLTFASMRRYAACR